MKLYIANGTYVGTQAEAKKLDKGFEQVEVPTDKEGLIAYLNGMMLDQQIEEDLGPTPEQRRNFKEAQEGSLGGAERIMGRMDRQAAENALRAAQDAITHGLSLLKRKHTGEIEHVRLDEFYEVPEEASPLLD